MTFSGVTLADCKDYLRIDGTEDDVLIQQFIDGAKSHIRAYTGLDDTKLDTLPDTVIALYVIVSEMYENRTATDAKGSKFNELLDRILGSHSVNLL